MVISNVGGFSIPSPVSRYTLDLYCIIWLWLNNKTSSVNGMPHSYFSGFSPSPPDGFSLVEETMRLRRYCGKPGGSIKSNSPKNCSTKKHLTARNVCLYTEYLYLRHCSYGPSSYSWIGELCNYWLCLHEYVSFHIAHAPIQHIHQVVFNINLWTMDYKRRLKIQQCLGLHWHILKNLTRTKQAMLTLPGPR